MSVLYFLVGSLGMVGKLFAARNVWSLSVYAFYVIMTVVFPLSACVSIAFPVTSLFFYLFDNV